MATKLAHPVVGASLQHNSLKKEEKNKALEVETLLAIDVASSAARLSEDRELMPEEDGTLRRQKASGLRDAWRAFEIVGSQGT